MLPRKTAPLSDNANGTVFFPIILNSEFYKFDLFVTNKIDQLTQICFNLSILCV